jgi:UDP-N-acetylglucosamine--N-acetylmuramyl-(pentapeptide) pyrophosphoryl-undecaprenol N-acetylglucosamine transferase
MLAVSPKEVDQHAVEQVSGMEICVLPVVALTRGSELAFVRGLLRSFRAARKLFQARPPQAALAMGGFTSASPILAARRSGARTFLHESNTIPGRANRWLSWGVHHAFVGFPSTAGRLHNRRVTVTGTPVRPQFQATDPAACREALGLDSKRPVLLVMGGSQGASAINNLVINSLPLLAQRVPGLQWIHLTGPRDAEKAAQAYVATKSNAVVLPFSERMELALGAATAAVSRSGASSLAELAAMRLPAVLVPYPSATGNHQFHNARAFEATGAARLLEQKSATQEMLTDLLWDLVEKPGVRERMQNALAQWHTPQAAERIAEVMLAAMGVHEPAGEPAEGHPVMASIAENPDPGDRPNPPHLSRGGRLNAQAGVQREAKPALGREAQVTA